MCCGRLVQVIPRSSPTSGPSAGLSPSRPEVPEVQWSGWAALGVYIFSIAGALLFGLAAVGALVLYALATAPPALVLPRAARLGSSLASSGVFVIAASAPAPLIATALAYLTVRRAARGRVSFLQAMHLAPPYRWRHILWASGVAFALSLALDTLAIALGRPPVPPVLRSLTDTRLEWAVFSAWAIVGATLEEILYRGFLFPPAVRRFGPLGGILLVGLAFGAAHSLTYGLDVVLVGITGIMGLYLTLVRYLTGSTMPPLVAHVLINLYASLQLFQLTS